MSTLLRDIEPILRATREMLSPHWGKIEEVRRKTEAAHSAVTELDLATERYLRDAVAAMDPDAGFVGEEFGGDRERKRFWLCDPIDGTGQFIRGLPFCCVMLALIEDGRVNFSVIYDFLNDILYHAERGAGAFREGERIRVSERSAADAYIAYSTRLDKEENLLMLQAVRRKAVITGSTTSGYESCLIATGKYEGRVDYDTNAKDWDIAPGSLLISEAGGIVANIGSRNYDYRDTNVIAANEQVYRALTEGADAPFPIRD